MSNKFSKVKNYYDNGMWNIKMVRNAVVKKWINEDEFEIITGIKY